LLRLGFARVELYHFIGNDPSGRVAIKAGFRHEGILRLYAAMRGEPRDCVMYSLVASDIE
jgi:RimJ/RimL family protein N-acetyltransferase